MGGNAAATRCVENDPLRKSGRQKCCDAQYSLDRYDALLPRQG
jgi:hypothetical protein